MSTGLISVLRRANETKMPEDSIWLRLAILGAVLTGMLALALEGAIAPTTAVLLVPALGFAYWVSWVRRGKENWHIKIALTVAAIFALMRFLGQLRGVATLDEVRFPLADLFLWIQVIHGFDLPQRRDLNFSLGSSLTLMAVAGSVSQDLRFGVMLVVYFALAIAALVLSHRSEVEEKVIGRLKLEGGPRNPTSARPWGPYLKAAMATVLAASLLFLVIPQPAGLKTFSLPFSLGGGLGTISGGGLINPGFGTGEASARSSGSAYYGFSETMDLTVRGDLSDDLMMRVRSSDPAMWRGMLFDTYDGTTWSGDRDDPSPMGAGPPFHYPPILRGSGPRATVSATFYIEAEQPNAVFTPAEPDEIWYDGVLLVDDLGALRTDATLTPGGVYSVLAQRGAATAEELRAAPRRPLTEDFQRYVQLPSALPERVGALAQRITAGADTQYDKVRAIEDYLRDRYRYDLDSPVPPPGRDAVDHFLFDTDVGFCEQFASATVVMLRTLGIPARVAVGYTTGERNPFTGYYEVRASDAHSWIEVWFPTLGWYEFDPTYSIPPAQTQLADSLPLTRAISFLVSKLAPLLPQGAGRWLKMALVAAAVVTILIGLLLALDRRRRRLVRTPRPLPRGRLALAFRRLEDALEARGEARSASETAAETIRRSGRLTGLRPALAVAPLEQEVYGPADPPDEDAARAVAELERMASALSPETTDNRPEERGR